MENNSILNKFDIIEINNNSRITDYDQEFCEDQERQYKESIKIQLDFSTLQEFLPYQQFL